MGVVCDEVDSPIGSLGTAAHPAGSVCHGQDHPCPNSHNGNTVLASSHCGAYSTGDEESAALKRAHEESVHGPRTDCRSRARGTLTRITISAFVRDDRRSDTREWLAARPWGHV